MLTSEEKLRPKKSLEKMSVSIIDNQPILVNWYHPFWRLLLNGHSISAIRFSYLRFTIIHGLPWCTQLLLLKILPAELRFPSCFRFRLLPTAVHAWHVRLDTGHLWSLIRGNHCLFWRRPAVFMTLLCPTNLPTNLFLSVCAWGSALTWRRQLQIHSHREIIQAGHAIAC